MKQNQIHLIKKLYTMLFNIKHPGEEVDDMSKKALETILDTKSPEYLDALGSSLCSDLLKYYSQEELSKQLFKNLF